MNDAVSNETSLTAPMTAGALLGDYPSPTPPDRSKLRCNGAYAPRWLNWPKRCERALLRYLTAQQGQGFPVDLARAKVELIEGSARSSARSPVQRAASAAA